MELKRFPDWPQRLARTIAERRSWAHAWGTNDCAIFAADCVAAMTGVDFAVTFRGRYSDQASAEAMLKAHGWATLEELADSCLPRATARTRRGDVLLCEGRIGPFLGVAWAGGVMGPGPKRVMQWPMKGILARWAVG